MILYIQFLTVSFVPIKKRFQEEFFNIEIVLFQKHYHKTLLLKNTSLSLVNYPITADNISYF